jgi:integrase
MANRDKGVVYDDEKLTVGEYLDRWLSDAVRGTIRESTYSRDKYLVTNHVKPTIGRLKVEALYVLAVHTGMRRGELLGLKWDDVDLEAATVRVRRTLTRTDNGRHLALGEPKTKKSRRTVRLTQKAVEVLKSHRARQAEEKLGIGSLYQNQGLVFAGEGGGLINPSNLRQRSFVPLLERAGLPRITFHDLRHTCASLLFQRNVHPKFVQELLGHTSVAITLDTYSHMLPGMGGEAADAIREALG